MMLLTAAMVSFASMRSRRDAAPTSGLKPAPIVT